MIGPLAPVSLLIRNYLETTPEADPPAPAPAPTPVPPTTPPAFAVSAVAELAFTAGTALGSPVNVATITTTEPSVAIVQAVAVPGLTFALTGSPVTAARVTGTPTTAGRYRIVLVYVRNDGSNMVLGSSTHDVVVAPSASFAVTAQANYSGQVGTPVDLVLAEAEIAANVEVTAHWPLGVAGMQPVWTWTRGTTSTGELRLTGTPAESLALSGLFVSYRINGREVGTSIHSTQVAAAFTPPPPAPAPSPIPPAPAPAPPAPTPAPPPVVPADPLIASVLMLHRFDAADVVTIANSGAYNGWAPTIGPSLFGTPQVGTSAERQSARLVSGPGLAALSTAAMGGASSRLTVECFVKIDPATGLWAAGNDRRYSPLVSVINPGDQLVWTLGFASFVNSNGRYVALQLTRVMPGTAQVFWYASSPDFSAGLSQEQSKFIHAAGAWGDFGNIGMGCWWDGGGLDTATSSRQGVPHMEGAIIRLGGHCPLAGTPLAGSTLLPLIAEVDELRITGARRFGFTSTFTTAIASSAMVTPFPNY